MFEVRRYTPDKASEWNRFVAQSKNGTFLFDRRFMDYHADRFEDCSLMVYRRGVLYALLPANVKGEVLASHGGLTYGGLIMSDKCSAKGVQASFAAINDFLRSIAVLFALTSICQARLIIRDISSAIIGDRKMHFSESRLSGLRKACRQGLIIKESTDFDKFWQILNDNLTSKYGVRPVHSAEELVLLNSRFPDKIRLFMVFDGERPLGGTVLFLTPQVLHTQYISATAEGKASGAIDLLFDHLINQVFADYRFIDFGKSTSSDSADLNEQLIFQKEGFGARAVCYDTYEYDL